MTLKNQMWVSYNNQPHFIEHIRTHNVLIKNLKEDTVCFYRGFITNRYSTIHKRRNGCLY